MTKDLLSRSPVLISVLMGVGVGCGLPDVSEPSEGVAATERLATETDPIRRLAILRELARTPGIDLAPICGTLDDRSLNTECEWLRKRPHLRTERLPPGLPGLDLPKGALGPLAEVSPAPDPDCTGRASDARDACQALFARRKAQDSGPQAAAEACAALDQGRDECMFRVAEVRMVLRDTRGAADLCLASASLSRQCFVHLCQKLSLRTPSPYPGGEQAWQSLAGLVEDAVDPLEVVGEAQASTLRERLWAYLFAGSLKDAREADGTFLAGLPSEVRPQYTGALAWRLAGDAQNLDAFVEQVLAGTRGPITLPPASPAAKTGRHVAKWTPLLEDEEQTFTVIPFLTDGWRLSSPDPAVDAAICVLDGHAAKGQASLGLLEDGLAHPSPLVRWTAVRLLPTGPEAEALRSRVSEDADPLVQARALHSRGRRPSGALPDHRADPGPDPTPGPLSPPLPRGPSPLPTPPADGERPPRANPAG